MDVAKGSAFEPMLTTADLAAREDFRLGEATISPSTRTVTASDGKIDVEPRVMQVLVVLADAAGHVVTRSTLFSRCWGGVYVGDDSLNRAVAGVRRIADGIARGSFAIETVTRTGYRLIGAVPQQIRPDELASGELNTITRPSRRLFVVGGLAAASAVAGFGFWSASRSRLDRRFGALMDRGDEAIRNGTASEDPSIIPLYEQAVRLQPESAKAWGLLAYFKSWKVDHTSAEEPARTTQEAQDASRRALAIDPNEAHALTATFLLRGPMLDWAARDEQLRGIVAIDASNILSMTELMTLLQATGLTRESWSWNERILKLAPLSRPHLVMRAMKLWILGNVAAADKVINRVRGLWPLYEFGFGIRLMLFALTGRPRAALAMLGNAPEMDWKPARIAFWRTALEALETRTSQAVEAAHIACLGTAKEAPWSVNSAVMILCALGQKEAAFELTEGYLLWRGKVVSTNQVDARAVNDWNRRMAAWLFTPPAAVMRTDPRFVRLCEEFGLADYWRRRGVKPDYAIYG